MVPVFGTCRAGWEGSGRSRGEGLQPSRAVVVSCTPCRQAWRPPARAAPPRPVVVVVSATPQPAAALLPAGGVCLALQTGPCGALPGTVLAACPCCSCRVKDEALSERSLTPRSLSRAPAVSLLVFCLCQPSGFTGHPLPRSRSVPSPSFLPYSPARPGSAPEHAGGPVPAGSWPSHQCSPLVRRQH